MATVSCAVPAPLMLAGLTVAVPTLPGRPDADSATLPANPFSEPTETMKTPLPPAFTLAEPGVAPRVKSGGAVTLSVADVVRVSEPPLAVMVSG